MADPEDVAHQVVGHLLAAGEMERTASYAQRGRRFADLAPDALQGHYVDAYRLWAASPPDGNARLLVNDLDAEYALRGENAPTELVRESIDQIVRYVAEHFEQLTPEQIDEANSELLAEYEAMKRSES